MSLPTMPRRLAPRWYARIERINRTPGTQYVTAHSVVQSGIDADGIFFEVSKAASLPTLLIIETAFYPQTSEPFYQFVLNIGSQFSRAA